MMDESGAIKKPMELIVPSIELPYHCPLCRVEVKIPNVGTIGQVSVSEMKPPPDAVHFHKILFIVCGDCSERMSRPEPDNDILDRVQAFIENQVKARSHCICHAQNMSDESGVLYYRN